MRKKLDFDRAVEATVVKLVFKAKRREDERTANSYNSCETATDIM